MFRAATVRSPGLAGLVAKPLLRPPPPSIPPRIAARRISHLPPSRPRLQIPYPRPQHRTYQDPRLRLQTARPLLTTSDLSRAARSPATFGVIALAVAGAFIFYFSNLETVPVSGRTRFNVYSPSSVAKVADMQYRAVLYELETSGAALLPDWDARTMRVRRVMAKLIPFSGMTDEAWEIFVIDNPDTANAFVLPGGKVFVFSGILPLAATDSQLAAVLGHEIAHNVAQHVGESMSQAIGTNVLLYSLMAMVGVFGLGPLLMHWVGSRALNVAFGNPMSRIQESEADYIGLMMMAQACYDPAEAAHFWARMEAATQGAEVPEWLSTHPSHSSRIRKIQEWLPEALEKRNNSDCHSTESFADLFRRALLSGVIRI